MADVACLDELMALAYEEEASPAKNDDGDLKTPDRKRGRSKEPNNEDAGTTKTLVLPVGYRLVTVAIQSAIQSEYSRKYDVKHRNTVLERSKGTWNRPPNGLQNATVQWVVWVVFGLMLVKGLYLSVCQK